MNIPRVRKNIYWTKDEDALDGVITLSLVQIRRTPSRRQARGAPRLHRDEGTPEKWTHRWSNKATRLNYFPRNKSSQIQTITKCNSSIDQYIKFQPKLASHYKGTRNFQAVQLCLSRPMIDIACRAQVNYSASQWLRRSQHIF